MYLINYYTWIYELFLNLPVIINMKFHYHIIIRIPTISVYIIHLILNFLNEIYFISKINKGKSKKYLFCHRTIKMQP